MNRLHKESGLAEALEQGLAEGGSGSVVLDRDVADLVRLARMLEDTATLVVPSDEFRARSRQRLLMHMARSGRQRHSLRTSIAERARGWVIRFSAALAALSIAGGAAAGASASALPGDLLYPLKQVTEATVLQLAPSDSARQDLLLHQADTRLDETARLLQQGRDTEAGVTVARYDDTLAALTAPANPEPVQSQLGSNEARLNELQESAPPPARPGLERALAVTKRSLNRPGPTPPPGADAVAVQTAVAPKPEPHQSQRPSDVADAQPAAVGASVAAKFGERGGAATPEGPAASHREDLQHRLQPTPVGIEPDTAAAEGSSIESDASPAPDGSDPAARADAPVVRATESAANPRANAHADTAQPGRTATERSGAPRPAPAGRGRP